MYRVLTSSTQGRLVFVAPTKALVNQVAAQVCLDMTMAALPAMQIQQLRSSKLLLVRHHHATSDVTLFSVLFLSTPYVASILLNNS